MSIESKYLIFSDMSFKDAKTKRVGVCSKTKGLLGEIKWFGRWRQYVFFPYGGTVFNIDCMKDICEEIEELKEERKGKMK